MFKFVIEKIELRTFYNFLFNWQFTNKLRYNIYTYFAQLSTAEKAEITTSGLKNKANFSLLFCFRGQGSIPLPPREHAHSVDSCLS